MQRRRMLPRASTHSGQPFARTSRGELIEINANLKSQLKAAHKRIAELEKELTNVTIS